MLANEGNPPSRRRTFRKPELYDLETFPWSRVSKITEWSGNNAPDSVLRKSKPSVTVLGSLVFVAIWTKVCYHSLDSVRMISI